VPDHSPRERNRRLRRLTIAAAALLLAGLIVLYAAELDVRLGVNAGAAEGVVIAQEGQFRRGRNRFARVRSEHLTVLPPGSDRRLVFTRVRPEVTGAVQATARRQRRIEIDDTLRLPRHRLLGVARGRVEYAGLGRRVVHRFIPASPATRPSGPDTPVRAPQDTPP
jgi:hypothetical protein